MVLLGPASRLQGHPLGQCPSALSFPAGPSLPWLDLPLPQHFQKDGPLSSPWLGRLWKKNEPETCRVSSQVVSVVEQKEMDELLALQPINF